MADVDVAGDVVAIIAKRKRVEKPVELSDRLAALGLESLDSVEMIFDLEEKFDIQIPYNANDATPGAAFETVADVVDAIKKLVDQKKS